MKIRVKVRDIEVEVECALPNENTLGYDEYKIRFKELQSHLFDQIRKTVKDVRQEK